ncbi:MAG: transposase [Pirellulales bacterium]|nr:transposase [Pirellulales bacterium]
MATPFAIQETNVKAVDAVAFVKKLKRRLRRPLIIVWDRWNVHRSAEKQIAASRLKRVSFEQLPAYAPELNPVEPRWSHTKHADLANFVPDDVRQLKRAVNSSLKNHASASRLKESFFKSAQLKI